MAEIAALLLAAGAASRFGSPKQLATLADGRSLIEHAVDSGRAVAGEHLYVVLGAHRERIAPRVQGATIIVNPLWQQGLGASLTCAARHLEPLGYDGILVYLADQVGLEAVHLRRLCQAFDPHAIVCADYGSVDGDSVAGVPALFPACCLPALCAMQGDSGAGKLLRSGQFPVRRMPLPAAALDIDTPEQLAAYLDR